MRGFQCGTCGEYHDRVPLTFGPEAPYAWDATAPEERGTDSALGEEQCVLHGRDFFVRGCLDLRIRGTRDALRWIVWLRVSRRDFMRMAKMWRQRGREADPPFQGRLDTALPDYPDTLGLPVLIQTRPVGERPQVWVTDLAHPLRAGQDEGVSWEEVVARVERLLH